MESLSLLKTPLSSFSSALLARNQRGFPVFHALLLRQADAHKRLQILRMIAESHMTFEAHVLNHQWYK